ncbi:PAS domain-containing protein [Streptomyces marianii]|uniref:PAS domain-containing protein n=1 Tax=Streptomyces marianii TaxID=1817406 RepID=A0A5R9E178_9ACTN|nr:PAS domain-containing protein [Streptomyces marianii]TLQ42795.1 hypothetical protein FEF34_06115 [Streptomyces marianii]
MDGGVPPVLRRRSAAVGPAGLAVVLVDGAGRVSHWSAGARALFGHDEETAVGRPAADLLPVSGALTAADAALSSSSPGASVSLPSRSWGRGGRRAGPGAPSGTPVFYPVAGRARLGAGGGRPREERIDVLWWAYPLPDPGPERLLVLAADAGRFGSGDAPGGGRVAPGFALHAELPDSGELLRRLAAVLPGTGVRDPGGIVGRVRELGCPVIEFDRADRMPATPERGVPRCRSFVPGGAG